MDYGYKGLDGRAALEALFGVKYYLAPADRSMPLPAGVNGEEVLAGDVGGTTVRVCENEAALPIGFTVGERLTRAQYDLLSPAQRQDALLGAVLLEDGADTVLPPATDPWDAVSAQEKAAMAPADRLAAQRESTFFWGNERTYLRLLYNGAEGFIHYIKPNSQYYCGRHDFVYNFGRSEQGLTEVKIVLAYAGYYRFDSLTLEYQPVADLAAHTAPRREEALQNVTLGANSLTGGITVGADRVLVLQVPYSSGWRALVDGAPAEILRADTAFIGLALGPGAHTIELRYQTPGLALTVCGVLAFVLIALTPRLLPLCRRKKTDLQAAL